MSNTPTTPADWRAKIEQLQDRLADAEQGLEDAKANAAKAVLDDNNDDTCREVALWRDRIDAVRSAIGAAQRHLADAERAVTDKSQKAALAKTHTAARDRHNAAKDFDEAMVAAEHAYNRFLAANMTWRKHMLDAGQKALSTEKLNAGEAIRGAVAAAAYTLSVSLDARPYNREMRLPLASFCAKQTPWGSAKATNKKQRVTTV